MSIEDKIKELEAALAELKGDAHDPKEKNVYYSVPIQSVNHMGRKTITNILYTTDKFEPGEIKRRIFNSAGESRVVGDKEYRQSVIDGGWFDSPWEAKLEAATFEEVIEPVPAKKAKKSSGAQENLVM